MPYCKGFEKDDKSNTIRTVDYQSLIHKPKRLYLAQRAQPLSLCRSILLRVQQVLERIRRVALCLFYRMDVAVGGFELGVTESCGDVFDVGAVAQEQRRRGVAQGVELLVRKVMALEEFAEPERRRGRVHRLAVA